MSIKYAILAYILVEILDTSVIITHLQTKVGKSFNWITIEV